jgi:hypothetical protein
VSIFAAIDDGKRALDNVVGGGVERLGTAMPKQGIGIAAA